MDALEEADAAYEAAEAAYLTALRSQADRGVLAKLAASVAAAAGAWNTLAYAAFHAAANQPHQPNLDRLTGDGGSLEVKTTHFMKRDLWEGGEVPARVFVQVQHQLAVSGLPHSHVACLIGGQKFTWLTIARDEEFIGHLTGIEAKFWQQVQDRVPPEVDGLRSGR